MNLWLTHFGILFMGSGALMIGIAWLTSGGFPIWLFLIWVIGSLAASVPFHRAIRRARTRSLLRRLESDCPESTALAVQSSLAEWAALVSSTAPGRGSRLGERYRWGARVGPSRDYLAALITDRALQFWGGPPSNPRFLLEASWADVTVDRTSGDVRIQFDDQKTATLRFLGDPSSATPLSELELAWRLVQQAATNPPA